MREGTTTRLAFAVSVWTVIGFVLLPLGVVVWLSFFANRIISFPPTGYTLAWYARAWGVADFRNGLLLSLQLGGCATLGSLLLGAPAALALVRGRFPGREALSTLLLAPMIVPGIVGGSALFMAYIEFEVATDQQLAGTLPGLLAAHVLIARPWTVRLLTASLTGLDRAVEEAAANLGASPRRVFLLVTLPMVRPGVIAAALFSFVISFIDLEKSLFLVGPGRTTLQIAIVNYLEWNLDPTIGAVATVQILIITAALVVTDRYAKLSRVF